MPLHHGDLPAHALAHGAAKAETIELTRRRVDAATLVMVRRLHEQADRLERELAGREPLVGVEYDDQGRRIAYTG